MMLVLSIDTFFLLKNQLNVYVIDYLVSYLYPSPSDRAFVELWGNFTQGNAKTWYWEQKTNAVIWHRHFTLEKILTISMDIDSMDYVVQKKLTCSVQIIYDFLNTIVRCCIYLTTYDWIKSFLKITIERGAIYGNLENKINTLYLARRKFHS
jgi:hypothetical protein